MTPLLIALLVLGSVQDAPVSVPAYNEIAYQELGKLPLPDRKLWITANGLALRGLLDAENLGDALGVQFVFAEGVNPDLPIFIAARDAGVRDILVSIADEYYLRYEVVNDKTVIVKPRKP
jgi:hypothetical protein